MSSATLYSRMLWPLSALVSQTQHLVLAVLFLTLLAIVPAQAQLVRVGPVDRNNGFPAWYQDSTGLALNACLPNARELADGSCLITSD